MRLPILDIKNRLSYDTLMKSLGIILSVAFMVAAIVSCRSSSPTPAEGADEPEATAPVQNEQVEPPPAPARIPAPPDVAAPPDDAERSKSGLAWKVLKEGHGDKHPGERDVVTVHYTGWWTDGLMFDSSVNRPSPAEFSLQSVIPGWTEGLQMMVPGEKRRFWIPANLAYGEAQGNERHVMPMGPPLGPLVFDVELISFKAAPKPPKDVAKVPKNAEKSESGLASLVLKKGTGKEHPTAKSTVTVNYSGWTTDGNLFDSSVMRGEPATFRLNELIPGWVEGLQLMVVGEKRRLWIPEDLGYAGRPNRPKGMLVVDVELLDFTN